MTIVDANVLLYAYDASSSHHDAARRWLERALSDVAPVRFAWVTILAFLRIATSPRILAHPLSLDEATNIVSSWLDRPMCALIGPAEEHWPTLTRVLAASSARGALVMDAHLVTLAVEHGAALCTFDRDFARFDGVRVIRPG